MAAGAEPEVELAAGGRAGRRRLSRTTQLFIGAALSLVVAGAAASAATSDTAATRAAVDARRELTPLPFDRILRYEEFTRLLQDWAAARPGLVELESIGRSPEGRELWFLTVTNRATGAAADKPALLVDGNMHAIEAPGGVAALNFVWRLLREYGKDERVTKLVDTRAVYVLPRLSPDGVETVLRDVRIIRSAIRPAPDEPPFKGLRFRDIDGDGRIVFMRFRDPSGPWKQHSGDRRLMVPREPGEDGGDYWRVVPEGTIEGYDGTTIAVPPALEGIDFGVFFPDDRDPVPPDAVSNPDPVRVPEVAAYVEAIRRRPNIVAHVTCHSFGGGLLMPPVNPTEQMPVADKLVFEAMGKSAAATMGYEPMSYLDLRAGQMLDEHIPTEIGWLYNKLGIFSFITEFWNPLKAAGIELESRMSLWLGGLHPVEDDLRLLRWNDEELGGRGFVPWHAFHHPQLGAVEIGGWDKVNYWYNAPLDRLEREVAPQADWLIGLGLSSPRLAVQSFTAEPSGRNEWRVRLVLQNTGWLPTYVSQRALDRKVVEGIVAELDLPAGARLLEGDARREAGQLAGMSEQRSISTWWSYEPGTPDRTVVDWRVVAPAGGTVAVTASHSRAGTVRDELRLRR